MITPNTHRGRNFTLLYFAIFFVFLILLLISIPLFSQSRNLYFRSNMPDNTITNLVNWSIGSPDLTEYSSYPTEFRIDDTLIIPAHISYSQFVVGRDLQIATIKSEKAHTTIGLSPTGPNITLHAHLTVNQNDTLIFGTTLLTVIDTVHIAGWMSAVCADFHHHVTISGELRLTGDSYFRGNTSVSGTLTNRQNSQTHFQKNIYSPSGLIKCLYYCYIDGDYDSELTINEDGNTILGDYLHFSKYEKVVRLNSNLNIPATNLQRITCLFYSQRYHLTVNSFNTNSDSGPGILRYFPGSIITTKSAELYENPYNINRFDSCDFICISTSGGYFHTYSGDHKIQSITLQGTNSYSYYMLGHSTDTIGEVHLRCPGLNISSSSDIANFCVTDSFLIHSSCAISLGAVNNLPFRVRIRTPFISCTYPLTCNNKSSLHAFGYGYLFTPQATVTSEGINFSAILFEGGNWQSNKSNDLGLNAGNIQWLNSSSGTTYYWVGENGSWHDPTKWSYSSGGAPLPTTACTPTITDIVVIDDNSFTSSGQQIIISKLAACNHFLSIDPNQRGRIEGQNNSVLNIAGNAHFSGLRSSGLNVITAMIGRGSGFIDTIYTNNQNCINTDIIFRTLGGYVLAGNLLATSEQSGRLQHIQGLLRSQGNDITIGILRSFEFDTATRILDLRNSIMTMAYSDFLLTPNLYLTKTSLRQYNFEGSHFKSIAPYNDVVDIRGNHWDFWDMTISPILGFNVNQNYINFSTGSMNRFHTIRLNSNVIINHGFSTDSLIVTPLFTYRFPHYNATDRDSVIITSFLGHGLPISECNILETNIISGSETEKALFELGEYTTLDGAVLHNIHIAHSGDSLIVRMATDDGSNSGKIRWRELEERVGRTFYWVGGAGNWDEANHWSIGISGGDPAMTNPDQCVPAEKDIVIFDTLSFSANVQNVYLNRQDIYIHAMHWLPPVGDRWRPMMSGNGGNGGNGVNIHLTGDLEWASGISLHAYPAFNIYFKNRSHISHSQTINSNSFISPEYVRYYFTGTGRYDMISDFSILGESTSFYVSSGSFFLNGYTLDGNNLNSFSSSPEFRISQATIADTIHIDNGLISTSGSLIIDIVNSNFFLARNANIHKKNKNTTFQINNYDQNVVDFGVLKMDSVISENGATLSSPSGNPVFARKITSPSYISHVFGNFQCDTFHVTYIGDHKTEVVLSSNTTHCLTVNHHFQTTSTPCVPSTIRSSSSSIAKIRFPSCLQLHYYQLQHLQADISGLSCRPSVILYGGNSTDYHNFNILSASPLIEVRDTTFECHSLPYFHNPAPGATSYLWIINDTIVSDPTPAIHIRDSGTYYVKATFHGGTVCQLENTLNVSHVVPIPNINLEVIHEICNLHNGAIFSTVTGAQPPYSFLWSTGDTSGNIDNLNEGGYYIIVTDQIGCTDSLFIDLFDLPSIYIDSIIVVHDSCGNGNGSITIQTSGGNGTLTYQWSNGESETPSISGLNEGAYQISISDDEGCLVTLDTTIISSQLAIAIINLTHDHCNQGNGSITLKISDAYNEEYTIHWGNQIAGGSGNYAENLSAGTYSISVIDALCTRNFTFTIDDISPPIAIIDSAISYPAFIQTFIQFQDLSYGDPVSWYWQFGDGDFSEEENPIHWYEYAGYYTVSLYISDKYGCLDSTEIIIEVTTNTPLYIPNIISLSSPINAIFKPVLQFPIEDDYYMEIYDRWGTLLFYTKNIASGWDGTFKGKGVATGTYAYIIQYRDSQSMKKKIVKGTITVIP